MYLNRKLLNTSPNKLSTSLLVFFAALLTGCGAGGGSIESKTGVLAPEKIEVTPLTSTVSLGSTTNLAVKATYRDGSSAFINDGVSWEITPPGFATIDSSGTITGVATGSTTVKAKVSGIISPSVGITVTSAVIVSINISTNTPSVPKRKTTDLVATAVYSDTTSGIVSGSVIWSSSNPAVASISNTGVVTGENIGSSTMLFT